MFAHRHPHDTARWLALVAFALAFAFALLGFAAKPAGADASQWVRSQPHWWDGSGAWGGHHQWRRQWHHRRHFKSHKPLIVIGGGGVFLAHPGFFVVSPGFVVRQPAFVVRQPAFVVRRPIFGVRQSHFIFERPAFAKHKHKHFFKRHPSLHPGEPWWHKGWKHKHWHKPHHGGVHFIRPGM
jgi:hypothetical protein